MATGHDQPTFIRFSRLPKELRDHIWDLAIQNHRFQREAHFFSVDKTLCWRWSNYDPEHFLPYWWGLRTPIGAPVWDNKDNTASRNGQHPAWDDPQNPSGYLMDSGLWDACPESREAMLRRSRKCPNPYTYGELVTGSTVFLAKGRRYVQADMDDIGGRWRLVEGADIVDTVVYFADRMCEHLEDHAADMADDPEHTHELILIALVCLHEDWLEC